jgi:FkbM family methyltransferase
LISYAYHHEDVVLARAFGDRPDGFYIDVGANHPTHASVTKLFSDRGWRGVNVEPNPALAALLANARPRDVNLPIGLSDQPGKLTLYVVEDESGLSTLDVGKADSYRKSGRPLTAHEIEVLTLAQVCDRYVGDTPIDFLSIDVEGHEGAVLAGADFCRWRPRVLVIESTRPYTNDPAHHVWEPAVLAAGYSFALFDGINRFYARSDEEVLLARLGWPANPVDNYHTPDDLELAEYRRYGRVARRVADATQWIVDCLKGRR